MDKKIEHSTVMVELDCLLDTRMGVLSTLGNDKVLSILNDCYHKRLIDNFKHVGDDVFKFAYLNRTKSVLKNSLITPVGYLLKEFCSKTLANIEASPFHYRPKILLNIYPYKLSEDEISVLIAGVVTITNEMADVQVIDKSLEEMHPMFVKNHLSLMIMYEYHKWLEIHSVNEVFKKVTCPDVTMIAPAIYFQTYPKDNKHLEAFKAVESMAAPFIGLQLFPIDMFSFVMDDEYKK